MTDDQGWGDIHSHGNSRIDTPVMDRLAREGVRFDRFYVSPVCAPTRASLLTGRYYLRTGTFGVTRNREAMHTGEVTIAEALKEAGYATGIFGKWHNGAHHPYTPGAQGFDEFFGFLGGHWDDYFDTPLQQNEKQIQTEGYINDVITDAAMGFIDENSDQPFFCYVPYNTPHAPFQVPDYYYEKYKHRGFSNENAAVYGMVENIDDNMARLLWKLENAGVDENTIVIFLTDNGPNGDRFNGHMRGNKGSVHEGGVRVPLFIHWPGRIEPSRVVETIAADIDLFPTIMELVGAPVSDNLHLDGRSLVPLLDGGADDWPDRRIFTHRSRGGQVEFASGSVRSQRWRAVNTGGGWELYDMISDPGQASDVAEHYPEVADELAAAYENWFEEVTLEEYEPPLIPISYDRVPVVYLPAHEASLRGDFAYGNWGTAHDWITDWTSTEDVIWWEVDVRKPGRYRVTLLYTCPPEDVGSRVRVSAGEHTTEATVDRAAAHRPRVRRDRTHSERVVKEFQPLDAGILMLEDGQQQLRITALEKPGMHVMDLKGVRLERIDRP